MKSLYFKNGIIILTGLACLCLAGCSSDKSVKNTIIEDRSHYSVVFGETRHYRVFLPPDYYENTDKVYPVIYFFHGFGGRFNGPAKGEHPRTAEARYYDEFDGDWERCGNDSLDNIAEYVRVNDVIVAKWDGYVKKQYPRPYDIGPVIEDIQFVTYFPEFVKHIESTYRAIGTRKGRAVSGLSMGGFMAMNIAAKFSNMVSSASFFCPSAAFTIGEKDLQVYTEFKNMKINYIGLPIRMHIGRNDFLRQYHWEMDQAFKSFDLAYESWHYGTNYFNGFHNVVNVEGQFDFHMKYFREPSIQTVKWHHIDIFPSFNIWGYSVTSNRDIPGFTILEDVQKQGFKLLTRKWLPEGPTIPDFSIEIKTDSLYIPEKNYQIAYIISPYNEVKKETVQADAIGRLHLKTTGEGSDFGIYLQGDPGHLSVSDFNLNIKMPVCNQVIQLKPIIFNKGGKKVQDIEIALISRTAGLEILTEPQVITELDSFSIHNQTVFNIRAEETIEQAVLKMVLRYEGKSESFLIEIPFFNPEFELKSFEIADGRYFKQENSEKENSFFGNGNGNGIANPGERISILTQPIIQNSNWYGLKLYTDDPYVDVNKGEMKFNKRNDWSGAMRATSEVYIKPDCPVGHKVKFYGEYDYPLKGNVRRDNQAAHSFIHEKKHISLTITIGAL